MILPSGDWHTVFRAYHSLVGYANGQRCVCGCGYEFTSEDEPIFTMNYQRLEGEDLVQLYINWFNTEACVERAARQVIKKT